ncbi:tRNA (adenosine(37)-N6)-threonylcarbamoyltransfe rase complex ATPase subunit type 1 TsaE [Desulfonema ishimotonii]|uniref:tRNA threonylcarbamoyladenosine biosynthesis protein TsaE n=1 Tax=Desulfonema ishimotonii TaxID=45657 RepID=A0A401G396_9BACT|nr:tRNA (adenosine(37)-N6)-threonylcarbamoyltransferase complex ATPase subunit type 1 TsaE [Desulfonema ishimotonii]GBC63718.1 tRNA (adenosine(37)-N6)-threonylcarbamoyltransfe rase complex ATPase subunit type 1 TsaE [Desulfonema ishimotonii]
MNRQSVNITTRSPEETRALAEAIGRILTPGTVIALKGDLGSGKTAFVQGLAKGLDVPEGYYVTSPTYTLINEYPGRYPLCHADLYRLEAGVDFEEIGLYDVLGGDGVVAVEWPERLHPGALADYLAVRLEITGERSRQICITAYGLRADNLLNGIEKISREKLKQWG